MSRQVNDSRLDQSSEDGWRRQHRYSCSRDVVIYSTLNAQLAAAAGVLHE